VTGGSSRCSNTAACSRQIAFRPQKTEEHLEDTRSYTFRVVPTRKKRRKRQRRVAVEKPLTRVEDWMPETEDPLYPSVGTVSWREESRTTTKVLTELGLVLLGQWLHDSWSFTDSLFATEILQRILGAYSPYQVKDKRIRELALALESVLEEFWHPEDSCGNLASILRYWPLVGSTLRLEAHRNRSRYYRINDWLHLNQGGLVPSRQTGGPSARYSSYTKGYGESPKRPSGVAPRVQTLDRITYWVQPRETFTGPYGFYELWGEEPPSW